MNAARRFDAIIFDMDGVIVNSEPLHEEAFMETFQDLGYADNHGIVFEQFLGRSDKAVWEEFIRRHQPKQSFDELVNLKESRLIRVLREREPLFPPAPKLIAELEKHYPLGLASGSLHRVINVVLSLQNLRRHFKTVVSSEDVPHGKPAPDVFLRAASLLGVSPQRCCVIEDTTAGIEAGRAAGMHVIAITNTYPAEQLHRAHHVVSHYDAIAEQLIPR